MENQPSSKKVDKSNKPIQIHCIIMLILTTVYWNSAVYLLENIYNISKNWITKQGSCMVSASKIVSQITSNILFSYYIPLILFITIFGFTFKRKLTSKIWSYLIIIITILVLLGICVCISTFSTPKIISYL